MSFSGHLVGSRTILMAHQTPNGRKGDYSVGDATKKRHARHFCITEEVQRPAREGREPETWGAQRVAPKIGNGYFLLQPSWHLIRATVVRGASGVQALARPACQLLSYF